MTSIALLWLSSRDHRVIESKITTVILKLHIIAPLMAFYALRGGVAIHARIAVDSRVCRMPLGPPDILVITGLDITKAFLRAMTGVTLFGCGFVLGFRTLMALMANGLYRPV